MTDLPNGYILRDSADPVAAQAFLTDSYWAKGVTLETVEKSFYHSKQVSIWYGEEQAAMARVITDFATYAYIQDVYVLEAHRGKGLGKAMIQALLHDPSLQNIGRWALVTKDAQSLYASFGFKEYPWPDRAMIIDPRVFPE